jgi:hypothetical protein
MRKLILILTILLLRSYGYCCDCNDIIGLKDAKSVFEGKVIGIEKAEAPYIYYQIKFKVSRVIKGVIKSKTIIVNTPSLDAGGCGIPFVVNAKYQVYTFIRYKKIYTGECTETKKLEESQ